MHLTDVKWATLLWHPYNFCWKKYVNLQTVCMIILIPSFKNEFYWKDSWKRHNWPAVIGRHRSTLNDFITYTMMQNCVNCVLSKPALKIKLSLKFHLWTKYISFNVWLKYFAWNFKVPWKFYTYHLTHILNDMFLYSVQCRTFRVLRFKSAYSRHQPWPIILSLYVERIYIHPSSAVYHAKMAIVRW